MSLTAQKLFSSSCGALVGDIIPPGDKSISHRSVMIGGIAEGVTTVRGLLEGEDVLSTVAALRAMGAKIHKDESGVWHIEGVGSAGVQTPKDVLDVGNSGTSARLLMGLVAGRGIAATFTGDASLRKRPMGRVIDPLTMMGARFEGDSGKLPLTVTGSNNPNPIRYVLPMASAQVKSAILLAGLNAEGVTTVVEAIPTRDHSENMLRGFGADVRVTKMPDGSEEVSITGGAKLRAMDISVPADPSSSAFPLVAALLRPGSLVTLRGVGINPRRAGLLEALRLMGADMKLENLRDEGGEPVADIVACGSELRGIDLPPEHASSMIDEYPILSVAAACARGTMRMRGLGELRVKESDRLSLMAKGLAECGASVEIEGDDLIVHGTGEALKGGVTVETAMDHRIAMSFLVLGMNTTSPVSIDDGSFIATSFPGFVAMMNGLGARIG